MPAQGTQSPLYATGVYISSAGRQRVRHRLIVAATDALLTAYTAVRVGDHGMALDTKTVYVVTAPGTWASASAVPTASVTEAKLSFSDVTTNDVTSTKHGLAPKSPAAVTQFLNGGATPAYAAVKDSDLATTDVTTNDVTTAKHGFAPKAPNDATQALLGNATYGVAVAAGNGVTLSGKTVTAISSTAGTADVTTSETTTSTTYADLATSGPAVTVTIGASGKCLVIVSALMSVLANSCYMSFTDGTYGPNDVDGAHSALATSDTVERMTLVAGLAPGSHTFTAKYRVVGVTTGTFADRRLIVVPL